MKPADPPPAQAAAPAAAGPHSLLRLLARLAERLAPAADVAHWQGGAP